MIPVCFLTLPTKRVVDYEALLKILAAGPILLRAEDHPTIKALYLRAQQQGAGKLSMKAAHLIKDGQPLEGFIVKLKKPSKELT